MEPSPSSQPVDPTATSPEANQESNPSTINPPTEINESTNLNDLSNAQLHELNQNLLNEIADIDRPLIDDVHPISSLREEYERGSPSFVQQIDWLKSQGYAGIRRTKGDGDCFYRSVGFAYIENLIQSPDRDLAVVTSLSTLETAKPMMDKSGFMSIVYEDPYEIFESLVKNVVNPGDKGEILDVPLLLSAFQHYEVSNYVVMFFRLLTSAQIRQDPDEYAPFLFHPETGEPMEVQTFCPAFVEATGKEADHVQMTALTRALKINVDVAYLDGRSADGKVDFVQFRNSGNAEETPLVLLYRPGHYDILIRQK